MRLPRLVGLQQSLQIILPGAAVSATKAKKIGLVDVVLPAGDRYPHENRFYHNVRSFAGRIFEKSFSSKPPGKTLQDRFLDNTALGRFIVGWMAERNLNKLTHGKYPAAYVALDTVKRNLSVPPQQAFKNEAVAFGKLSATAESKNLMALFFLMEGAKKRAELTNHAPVQPIHKVGVIGAGVMGSGIAQLVAHKNLRVHMKDIKDEFVSKGMDKISELFKGMVSRRRMTPEDCKRKLGLVTGSTSNEGFRDAQIVIEAAVEQMKLKQVILRECEQVLGANDIFATNTSSLSITELQSVATRPENVVGMHFFNPVHKMPLVEVVRGKFTSDAAVATVYELALQLGKTPVIVGDGPGFLVNRILGIYLNEAGRLLAEGADIKAVDSALLQFGMPMGPFRLLDEVGLDVGTHVAEVMHQGLGERFAPPPNGDMIGKMVASGRLGKKSGQGFYRYNKGRSEGIDPFVSQQLSVMRKARAIPSAEVVDRCVLLMVNEAARILEEGIAARPEDVDLGMVFGTGFPPFRGGLLQHADSLTVSAVVQRLNEFHAKLGARYRPAPLLVKMAAEGKRFFPDRPLAPYVERKTPRARL